MKNNILFFLLFIIPFIIFSQTPEKMSYQAIVRDADNALAINQVIGIQIDILQGSATGTPVYQERHNLSTNENGLLSLEIGTGTVLNGIFSDIDWPNNSFFIKTAIDLNGGTNYNIIGTSQLISVPYALHAKTVTNHGAINNLSDAKSNATSVYLGKNSGLLNTTGNLNTGLGIDALKLDTTGNNNTAIGNKALFSNTSGSENNAFGKNSLLNNTTGNQNTAIGRGSLTNNTTGFSNVSVGVYSLTNNIIGGNNVAIGIESMLSSTSGSENTAIGRGVLHNNTTGSFNVALGSGTLSNNTIGNRNIAIGRDALVNNITGNLNIAIGNRAAFNETGSNKLYIDSSSTLNPLIYGEFDNDLLRVNGDLEVTKDINVAKNIMVNENIEVTGKINAPISGTADMKAYIYGSVFKDGTINIPESTSGFTVEKFGVGKYYIHFPSTVYKMCIASIATFPSISLPTASNPNRGFISVYSGEANKVRIDTFQTFNEQNDFPFTFVVYLK